MKEEIRNVKLDGKSWRIQFVNRSAIPNDRWGDCNNKTRNMRVRVDLSDQNTLDTFLHEMLHAASYQLFSEDWVSETATEMARALLRSGRIKIIKD